MSCLTHIDYFRRTIGLIALVSLFAHSRSPKQGWAEMNQNEVTVNVFIHGIMSVKHFLTVGNFVRMMRDDVENSVYHKSLDIVREDPLCYINQAMQGYGLQPVDAETICPGNASGALAQLLTLSAQSVDPQNGSKQTFYTFGWPGVISNTLRIKAGKQLYNELSELVAQLREQYKSVRVRIYGFSHGGNVALNIAQYDNTPSFHVDELILVGTPIQSESDYLINDPIFSCVYNVFSSGDRIQTLDCFSFNRFFSAKQFTPRADFQLPDKLTQIELRLTEPAQRHKRHAIVEQNTATLNNGKGSFYVRDRSPGHSELWFFGWTPQYYRPNFPLNPLPMVVLLPIILASPQLAQLDPAQNWIVDVRPSLEYCLVRLHKDRSAHPPITLSAKLLTMLKRRAELFRPEIITQKQYDNITYEAIQIVSQQQEQEHQLTASSD